MSLDGDGEVPEASVENVEHLIHHANPVDLTACLIQQVVETLHDLNI